VARKSTKQRETEEAPENGMNEKVEDSSLLGYKPVSVAPDILRKHYCLHL